MAIDMKGNFWIPVVPLLRVISCYRWLMVLAFRRKFGRSIASCPSCGHFTSEHLCESNQWSRWIRISHLSLLCRCEHFPQSRRNQGICSSPIFYPAPVGSANCKQLLCRFKGLIHKQSMPQLLTMGGFISRHFRSGKSPKYSELGKVLYNI